MTIFEIAILFGILQVVISIQCQAGFTLDAVTNKCRIIGCQNPKQNTLCPQDNCLKGYKFTQPGYCYAQKCKEESSLQCKQCIQGYQLSYFSSSSVKVCSPKNCLTFSSKNFECSQCKSMHQLTKQKGCIPTNCKTLKQSSCIQCNQKFYNQNGLCVPETCSLFNATSKKCVECQKGYVQDDVEICINQKSLCTDYNNITGLCGSCRQGFKLVGLIKCVRLNQLCFQYRLTGCAQCITGYQIKENKCIPKGCKYENIDNNKQCQQCEFGYKLNQNRKCIVDNCISFNIEYWRCQQCSQRFYLSDTGLCTTKNCSLFDRNVPSKCMFCHPEYLLVNGQCHLMNCETPKAQICQKCDDGWILNSNSNCIIRDCLTYNGTICESCPLGKRLLRGLCVDDNCLIRLFNGACLQCLGQLEAPSEYPHLCVPFFCKDFDITTGQCLTCNPDFKMNLDGLCVNTLCNKFQTLAGYVYPQCTACKTGYKPLDRYCIPTRCSDYKLEQGICNNCSKKYQLRIVPGFPDQPKVCINYNCQLFPKSIEPTCIQCRSGYKYNSTLQECQPMNCSSLKKDQQQNIQCSICIEQFTLAFGICLANNCEIFAREGLCEKCLQGYILAQNKTCMRILCERQVKGRCLQCWKGYYVSSDGSCQPYNCKQVGTKLENQIQIPVCQSCIDEFVKQGNYCMGKDCSTFKPDFSCRTCRQQYALTSNLCFYQRDIINYCNKGEYFDKNIFYCQKISVPNCEVVDLDNPQRCLKCSDKFYLINSTCTSLPNCKQKSYYNGCLQCEQGFKKNSKGQCQSPTPYCNKYNFVNQCIECISQFSLISIPVIKCIQTPKSCGYVDERGKCIGCRDFLQIISNNSCIYYSDHCLSYHETHGQCTKCVQGYYYKSAAKQCQSLPFGCIKASNNGSCQICEKNLVKSAQSCYNKIPNCKTQVINQCTSCQLNYYITSNKICEQIPVYCVKMNPNGKCQQCIENYYSLVGTCTRKIDFCKEHLQEQKGCKKCVDGYTASDNRLFCLFAV